MDAVKFIEGRKRLCEMYANCSGCPANDNGGRCKFNITLGDEATKQIKLLEEWSAAHPRKTRQDVFLEQWPEAKIENDGCLGVCPYLVSAAHRDGHGRCVVYDKSCVGCRREFWMQEVE